MTTLAGLLLPPCPTSRKRRRVAWSLFPEGDIGGVVVVVEERWWWWWGRGGGVGGQPLQKVLQKVMLCVRGKYGK
jgi:hypothetical protein